MSLLSVSRSGLCASSGAAEPAGSSLVPRAALELEMSWKVLLT